MIALSPEPMLHDGLIAAHALSGVIAFALGIALALRRSRHPAQAMAYALALALMALFVTGAVILDWPSLARPPRASSRPCWPWPPTRSGAAGRPGTSSSAAAASSAPSMTSASP